MQKLTAQSGEGPEDENKVGGEWPEAGKVQGVMIWLLGWMKIGGWGSRGHE